MADNDKNDKVEKKVFEVRRTTYKEDISTDKFVFELHDKEWHAHFAAGSNYSLTQMKDIVELMESLPSKEGK